MIDWRPVPSLPGVEASEEGLIRIKPFRGLMPNGGVRTYGGKARKGSWDGTRFITLIGPKTYKIARLVCEAFHGQPPFEGALVLHCDENSRNNRPDNLKWGTSKENMNAPGYLAYCRSRTGDASSWRKGKAKKAAAPFPHPHGPHLAEL